MPVPLARPVSLTSDDHARLESLVRAHSTPQALAWRCRLLLRIAAPDQPSNVQVATEMDCERHTVGRWRQRSLAHGLTGLQDAPRSGRPRRFSPLGAGGCALHRAQETGHVSLSGHPMESRRSGRRTPPASTAAHESLQSVAYPGGGRPQAASECVLAQEPRSRLRGQSARHLAAPGKFESKRFCSDKKVILRWYVTFTRIFVVLYMKEPSHADP
jgi:hypothetical protein